MSRYGTNLSGTNCDCTAAEQAATAQQQQPTTFVKRTTPAGVPGYSETSGTPQGGR